MACNREIIHSHIVKLLLATAANATTAQTSASLDTRGFDAASFNLHFGTDAPAPTSIVIEESDDNSAWNTATATIVDYDTTASLVDKTVRVAYVGPKRYTRVVVTPNGATDLTITGVLGKPDARATANPA